MYSRGMEKQTIKIKLAGLKARKVYLYNTFNAQNNSM